MSYEASNVLQLCILAIPRTRQLSGGTFKRARTLIKNVRIMQRQNKWGSCQNALLLDFDIKESLLKLRRIRLYQVYQGTLGHVMDAFAPFLTLPCI